MPLLGATAEAEHRGGSMDYSRALWQGGTIAAAENSDRAEALLQQSLVAERKHYCIRPSW